MDYDIAEPERVLLAQGNRVDFEGMENYYQQMPVERHHPCQFHPALAALVACCLLLKPAQRIKQPSEVIGPRLEDEPLDSHRAIC